jgi:D-alanine-D-alanine ligase
LKLKGKKIAVLCGGWSAERSISLISGEWVYRELKAAHYDVVALDLLPAQIGKFHKKLPNRKTPSWAKPLPFELFAQRLAAQKIDLVFLMLHGPGGEDGKIQGYLEMLGIPFTGSSQLASTLAMNKHIAKEVFCRVGIPVASGIIVSKGQTLPKLKIPCVVKPADQGSAIGISIVRKGSQLKAALAKAWRYGDVALVEDFVKGKEFTVGVLGDAALPVVEIKPELGEFYDFRSKYAAGGSTHICPAPLSNALTHQAQALGLAAHRVLGCRAYSRTDMILDRRGRFVVLETNTLPGMTPVSLLPDAAKAAGYSYLELLEEMAKQI